MATGSLQSDNSRLVAGGTKAGSLGGQIPIDSNNLARQICKRQIRLEREWMDQWDIWDDVDNFVTSRRSKWSVGRKEGDFADSPGGANIYDATAQLSLKRFANGVQSQSANPLLDWWMGRFRGPLNDQQAAKKWMDDVKEAINYELSYSNFFETDNEACQDGATHGIATMAGPEWDPALNRLVFSEYHPREVFVAFDWRGQVNLWHRKFQINGRQIVEQLPEADLPQVVVKAIKDNPYTPFTCIHAVYPRGERDVKSMAGTDKKIASVWVLEKTQTLLSESGYDDSPWDTWIWERAGKTVTCPAIDAIYDVATTNAAAKSLLKAANLAVEPAYIITPGMKGHVNIFPAAETLVDNMQNAPKPLEFPNAFQVGAQQVNMLREELVEKFQANLFTMMADAPGQMTILQTSGIMGEKAALLIPLVTRRSNMLLVPKLNKTFRELAKWGRLPKPPDSIMQFMNTPVDIEMTGPISVGAKRFLNTQGFNAFMGTLEEVARVVGGPDSPIVKAMLEHLNPDELLKYTVDSNSAPQKVMFDDKIVQANRQMRVQMEQQQRKLAAMKVAAQAAKAGSTAPEEGSPTAQMMGGGA